MQAGLSAGAGFWQATLTFRSEEMTEYLTAEQLAEINREC
jgi:hypothetical protein